MSRKRKPDDGVITTSSGIARGSRMFVQLAALGECDEKGKAVLSFGFKGKAIAEPDRPLGMLAVGFIEQVVEMARWSSPEALRADLAELTAYVASLEGRAAADAAPPEANDTVTDDDGESD